MINYSLGMRLSNPADKNSEKKVYAYAQVRETLTLNQLAKHISSHGSPYTRDVVQGVMIAAVDCIREQLLQGNKVQLGEMGAFSVAFQSEGVSDANDFNPSQHIKAVRIHWNRGKEFSDLLSEATFDYVTTRRQQAASKKNEKAALNGETTDTDTSPIPGTGGGSEGGIDE